MFFKLEQASMPISPKRGYNSKSCYAAVASQQPTAPSSPYGRNLASKSLLTSECQTMAGKSTLNQRGSWCLTLTWTCGSSLMLTFVEQQRSEQYGTHRVVHAVSLTATFGGCRDRKQTYNIETGRATTSSWASREQSPSHLDFAYLQFAKTIHSSDLLFALLVQRHIHRINITIQI